MSFSTLNEWLEFQQGINPKEIDLSLERVKTVFERLQIDIPKKNVFLIGGTNGKGTTTSILEQLFYKNGYKTGAFTSPHLTQYNERDRINLNHSSDKDWISAFEIMLFSPQFSSFLETPLLNFIDRHHIAIDQWSVHFRYSNFFPSYFINAVTQPFLMIHSNTGQ